MLHDKNQNRRMVKLYGMKEVCTLWGISRWRVYDLVKEGKIRPIVNMGKGWKFDGTEFSEHLLERL
jgi:excisionase family DNA binding protein